jgi:UDP-glucose 4-epimerase
MNILILGSEGFIGSHAVHYFRSLGESVTSADIVLKDEKDYLLINPEFPDFSRIFSPGQFDVCINATGAANVQLSFAYPAMDYALNTANIYNILDGIRKYNPTCRFINLSSAAVYGNPASLPIHESAPLRPVSPYGYHKMYSEQICKEFYSLYGIPTISVRIFSAFGERLKKQLLWDVSQKIFQADGTIELFGTGNESRDFIYIADIMLALRSIIANADFDGSQVNIASGKESTIKEAVDIILDALEKRVNVIFTGNNKMGDPLNWRADIGKLESFGFKSSYSLTDGIHNYCRWVKGKS